MTKITEQLETLSQDEIKFIYEVFFEGTKRVTSEIENSKRMVSFTNAMKDLTEAYFPEGDATLINVGNPEEKTVDLLKEESKIYIEKLEKAKIQYESIVNKLIPLIELIDGK